MGLLQLYLEETDCRQLSSCFRASPYILFKGCMDLPKSKTTTLLNLVLKIWATGLVPRPGLGLGQGLAETCVIGLDISVFETTSNHPSIFYHHSRKQNGEMTMKTDAFGLRNVLSASANTPSSSLLTRGLTQRLRDYIRY